MLVRNGEEIDRTALMWDRPEADVEEAVFTDETPLDEIAIRDARYHPEPFVVYYVRVELANGQTQWTSPIWLDL